MIIYWSCVPGSYVTLNLLAIAEYLVSFIVTSVSYNRILDFSSRQIHKIRRLHKRRWTIL